MALVVWYRFSNEMDDVSGNGHHATNSGTSYVNALTDSAIDTSGVDNYITVPTTINDTYTTFHLAIKIQLTILPSVEGHDYYIVSLDSDKISVYVATADDKIYVTTNTGATVTSSYSTALSVATAYDIQLGYDGTNQYLYVNGSLVDTDAQTGSITLSATNLIGKYPTLVRNPEGLIDEFRLYDAIVPPSSVRMIAGYYDNYDARINGKTYAQVTQLAKYGSSNDAISADFNLTLFDPNKIIYNELRDDYDIRFYQDGDIVYRGQVDLFKHNSGITTVNGLDYFSILFSRYAIAKSYTNRTRQFIMHDLIGSYLGSDKGSIYFSINGKATGGTSTTVLINSSATFQTDNIEVGYVVVNLSDGEQATIVSIDSETQITTSALSGGASYDDGDDYAVMPNSITEVTTQLLTIVYPNVSVAEIFLTFSNEEDCQVFISPISSLPLSITYLLRSTIPLQHMGTDVIFDYDNPNNTTDGYRIYDLKFDQESRQVKNVFTVYGPATSKIAVEVRNKESIDIYGEKRAEPITDVNATTTTLARKRALEEQAKWENAKQKGTMITNDHVSLTAENTIKITSSEFELSETIYQIVEATHSSAPKKQTKMIVSSIIRNADVVLADILKKQRKYDMRDTDPSDVNITSFLTDFIADAWDATVSITGTATAEDNAKIGVIKIGSEKIGNQDTINLGDLIVDEQMIITTEGLDALRDALTNGANTLSAVNTYIQFGSHSSDLDATLTEATWTASYAVGNREQTTLDVTTAATASYDKTFTDTELSGNPTVNKVAILFGSSSGALIAVGNLTASITKVTGNDVVPEIKLITSDGGV